MRKAEEHPGHKRRSPPDKPPYPPSIKESSYAHLDSDTTLDVWVSELLSRNEEFRRDYSSLFETKSSRIAASRFLEKYSISGLKKPPPYRYLPHERIDVILSKAVIGTVMLTDERFKRHFGAGSLQSPPKLFDVDLSDKPTKVHLPKRVQVGGDPSCIIDSLRENPPGYVGFGRLLLAVQLSRPTDELYPEIIDRISSAKRILGIPSPRIKHWAKWLRVYDMKRRGTSYQRIQGSLRVRAEEPEKVLGKQFAKIKKLIDGGYKKFI